MIDFSFPLEELEYYLLILTRVTAFLFASPFFSSTGVPRRVRVIIGIFISFLLYQTLYPHVYPEYSTVFSYATIVIKEAIAGILIGLSTQLCMMITSFAGHMVDVEIGFSMMSTMDPLTRQNTTITGFLYQYTFMLLFIVTGMYEYLMQALADTFVLIPVGREQYVIYDLYNIFLKFLSDYIIVGFRIALPVICTILLLNSILGVMAKVSPQMNMFAVGIQLKSLTGLITLFITVFALPKASSFIFEQMKILLVSVVKAMGGG